MPKFYTQTPNSVIRVEVERYGSKTVEDISFNGNVIDTDDSDLRDNLANAAAEKYLAAIANRPGTGISTASDLDVDAEVRARKERDMREAAEAVQKKLIAAGEKP